MHTFALFGPVIEPQVLHSGVAHWWIGGLTQSPSSHGRKIAVRRLFQDSDMLEEAEEGFVDFSTGTGRFGGYDVLRDRGLRNPMLGGQLMGQHPLFYRS